MTHYSTHALPEARMWLEQNTSTVSIVAGNRFRDRAAVRTFVQQLYNLGATNVAIDGIRDEPWRIAEYGGPYADALVVTLPHDPQQRAALFHLHAEESENEGFAPTPDVGQATLRFWWD